MHNMHNMHIYMHLCICMMYMHVQTPKVLREHVQTYILVPIHQFVFTHDVHFVILYISVCLTVLRSSICYLHTVGMQNFLSTGSDQVIPPLGANSSYANHIQTNN